MQSKNKEEFEGIKKVCCNAPIFWKDIMVNIKFVKHKSPIF